MEDFEIKLDELEEKELIGAAFGTRVINAQVVELLWWSCLYKYGIDDKTYKEIATGKQYRYDQFGDIAMILYQMKYWYDLKCRENKHKHSFHKSAGELQQEFPWMHANKVYRILSLLVDLEILKREAGRYRPNEKKYTYELNPEHPIVFAMYYYEALGLYIQDMKRQDKQLASTALLMNLDPENVLKYITNNSYHHNSDTRITETVIPYNHNSDTVSPKWLHSTDTVLILVLNYFNKNGFAGTHENPFSVEKPNSSTSWSTKEKKYNFRNRITETVIRNASELEFTIKDKIDQMAAEEVEQIRALKVGAWRAKNRKGHYTTEKRGSAKDWFNTLDDESKGFVEAFQEEQWGNSRQDIEKNNSYGCSLVDAHELAPNLLQFFLIRTKGQQQKGQQQKGNTHYTDEEPVMQEEESGESISDEEQEEILNSICG
jgi:hypothetical protein